MFIWYHSLFVQSTVLNGSSFSLTLSKCVNQCTYYKIEFGINPKRKKQFYYFFCCNCSLFLKSINTALPHIHEYTKTIELWLVWNKWNLTFIFVFILCVLSILVLHISAISSIHFSLSATYYVNLITLLL
jgi:hypothetical protein